MINYCLGKSPRDLVCDISDTIQKYYTDEIWGELVYKQIQKSTANSIVIDDWRRLTESNCLEKKKEFNIIKVFLQKPDKYVQPSEGSLKYEGALKPSDCDIVFTYDDSYSNFEELIGLIKNEIK